MFAHPFAGKGLPPRPSASVPRSADGSSSKSALGGKDNGATVPFQRLKPICVHLLGLTAKVTSTKENAQALVSALERLKSLLDELGRATENDRPALTPALIHYVFYPIAQLLRACPRGAADLPDQVRQRVFECLALLASQWWRAWSNVEALSEAAATATEQPGSTQWAVWQQLVILGSVAIGGAPKSDTDQHHASKASPEFSDETRMAAVEFLGELLRPRLQESNADMVELQHRKGKNKGRQIDQDWEWDGHSELPSLDDLEREEVRREKEESTSTSDAQAPPEAIDSGTRQVYPSATHLAHALTDATAKGALGHALTSCLELACQAGRMLELRKQSLRVAHDILTTWIAAAVDFGSCHTGQTGEQDLHVPVFEFIDTDQPATLPEGPSPHLAERSANRIRPLLPGITSSLTRLVSGRLKNATATGGKGQTPGELSAIALAMLRNLIVLALSDRSTLSLRQQGRASTSTLYPADRALYPETRLRFSTLDELASAAGSFTTAEMGDRFEATSTVSPAPIEEVELTSPPDGEEPPPSDAAGSELSGEDLVEKYFLPTLARIQIALRSFSPLVAPFSTRWFSSSPAHSATRKGLLNLALSLFLHLGETLSWFDQQLHEEGTTDTSLGSRESALELLLSWLVDSAGEDDIASVVKVARQALDALFVGQSSLVSLQDPPRASTKARSLVVFSAMTTRTLAELPRSIRAHDDAKVDRLATRLATAVAFASGSLTMIDDQGLAQGKPIRFPEGVKALSDLFGPSGGVEEWGSRLADSIHVKASQASSSIDNTSDWPPRPALAGLESGSGRSILRLFRSFGKAVATVLELQAETAMRAGGSRSSIAAKPYHVILHFVRQGARFRTCRVGLPAEEELEQLRSRSTTALLIASEMLRGVAEELDDKQLAVKGGDAGKMLRKAAHKLGRQVIELVMEVWETDWEEVVEDGLGRGDRRGGSGAAGQSEMSTRGRDTSQLLAQAGQEQDETVVQRIKGLFLGDPATDGERPERFGPALDLGFVGPATLKSDGLGGIVTGSAASSATSMSTRFARAEASLNVSDSLLLSLLASSSMLLGQSFRPLLLRTIYPLTSGLASSDATLRSSAERALQDVAHASAYADVQTCVLDHADYLLGAACQRLVSGLDEELRAHYSLPALHHLGSAQPSDVVAASGHHAIVPLLSAQKAPFVLVEMIRMLGPEVVPLVEDAVDEIMDALDRFHGYSEVCTGLLGVLDGVLEALALDEVSRPRREEHGDDDDDDGAEKQEREELAAFARWYQREIRTENGGSGQRNQGQSLDEEHDETDPQPASQDFDGDTTVEATRTQQVVSQITLKAIPFLSHPSAMLRASVLRLLRHGIQVLGAQKRESEMLPIVNGAWPFIMARLGRSYTSRNSTKSDGILQALEQASTREFRSDQKRREEAERELTESEPSVWIEAARLVETIAEEAAEYVVRKVERDAWPRFETILELLAHRSVPQRRSESHSNRFISDTSATESRNASGTATSSSGQRRDWPPLLFDSATSLPAQLTLSILGTLRRLTASLNVRLTDDTAWQISTNRHLLACLDVRQPDAVREAGKRLFQELARRNWDATLLALRGAGGDEVGVAFLHLDQVRMGEGMVDEVCKG